ncbi:MAG: hypothetical protein IKS35_03450 [Clostridia bacterium]|nr:hypothetical protein [Clostridia bacterium]
MQPADEMIITDRVLYRSESTDPDDCLTAELVIENNQALFLQATDGKSTDRVLINDRSPYMTNLERADLDGDGTDEIVTHSCVSTLGGYFESRIFRWEDGELTELFRAAPGFDSGFRSAASLEKKDGNLVLSFDAGSGPVAYAIGSRAGSLTDGDVTFWGTGSFIEFSCEDPDGDGVYEVWGKEDCFVGCHLNVIGYAFSVWSYDPDRGEMIRTALWFEPVERCGGQ